MDMEPQPPPDIPAPPPGQAALRSRRWMKTIIHLGVGSLLLLFLAGIASPMFLRSRKSAGSTQALSNARQIGLALFDFDEAYGRFPDASTIAAVKSRTGSTWDLKAVTSNDLFKQIIVSGITDSEEIFYAKIPGTRKPDNVIASEAKALAPRECGFAYIAGASVKCASSRPLAVTPLIPGTLKADPKPFDGKAIVLRADNSAVSYQIARDGRIIAPGGKDLFDLSQPYWQDAPPDVKWADLPASPSSPADSSYGTAWIVVGFIALGGAAIFLVPKRKTTGMAS